MASEVEIANLALRKITASDRIDSLDAPNETARALSDVWVATRQRVLSEHPWNVAARRAILAPKSQAPLFGYAYAYALPTDPWCLRVWKLDKDRHGEAAWEVEGREILTNEGPTLYLHYIGDVEDVATFPPFLTNLFAEALGEAVAYRISGKVEIEARAMQRYTASLEVARSIDGQETRPTYAYADAFNDARV